MTTIKSKCIYYPETGVFMCEVSLRRRWDKSYTVDAWYADSANANNEMAKRFDTLLEAEVFFNDKVNELTETKYT